MLVERIAETRAAQSNLAVLRQSGADYADLTQARAALAQERLSTSALISMEVYQINVELASQVVGLDVEAIAADSRQAVDALVENVDPALAGSPELANRTNANGSIFVYYPLMEAADETLADRQNEERLRLRSAAVRFDDVSGLNGLADQLEVATEVQLAASRLGDTYLALRLQLEGWDPGDEAIRFQTAWFSLLRAEQKLHGDHLLTLEEDEAVAELRATFGQTVEAVAESGAESVALPLSDNLLQGLLPLQRFFRQFVSAFETYSSVTTESGDRFQGVVDEADRSLQTRIATSYAALALLAVAMIGSIWLTSKQVVSPLRRLTPQIHRLRRGESNVEITLSGAKEIRHAAVAINEAAATLTEVEQQSRALAGGDIAEPEPGPEVEEDSSSIGASMRRSLDELSAVMKEREQLREQLEHAAFHDVLTGLANRRGFRIRLDEAMAAAESEDGEAGQMTALYLDLDRFKSVNDSYGHAAGDALLVEVADRLTNTVRSTDVIGRMGGDEFLVVTFDSADRSGRSLASSLKAVIEVPYQLDGRTFTVGASVGFHTASLVTPIDLLIRCADAAAYYAKAHATEAPVAYTESIGDWMDNKNQPASAVAR